MKTMEIVCGILHDERGWLIARRGSGVHENIWEFPGGKVEPQESFEEAIVRELWEELSLECVVDQYLISIVDERKDRHLHVHAYLCHAVSGKLQLFAHHEVRYVSSKELNRYTFEKADQPILEAVQALSQE